MFTTSMLSRKIDRCSGVPQQPSADFSKYAASREAIACSKVTSSFRQIDVYKGHSESCLLNECPTRIAADLCLRLMLVAMRWIKAMKAPAAICENVLVRNSTSVGRYSKSDQPMIRDTTTVPAGQGQLFSKA